MSTDVKHIHSDMRGAPVITGAIGALIPALDTFLITGWGPVTALSGSVSGGVATLLFSPGQSFDRSAVVLVAGATPAGVNGESKVSVSTNTSIQFPTAAPDGAITGTVSVKYAPVGHWSKVYSGTNKAVYQSLHPQSNGHFLRVDDTTTINARVRGYETMSDIDTGVNPFPTDTHMSGGGYWRKRTSPTASAVPWRMFADGRIFLMAIAANIASGATHKQAVLRGFGDPIALSPSGDIWSTVLSYDGASDGNNNGGLDSNTTSGVNGGSCCMPRAIIGIGAATLADSRSFIAYQTVSGNDYMLGDAPSLVDGQVKMSRLYLRDTGNNPPRAITPGSLYIPQRYLLTIFNDGDIIDGAGDLAGRRLMFVATGSSMNQIATGLYLVDITGPWR